MKGPKAPHIGPQSDANDCKTALRSRGEHAVVTPICEVEFHTTHRKRSVAAPRPSRFLRSLGYPVGCEFGGWKERGVENRRKGLRPRRL